jgi:hypothetical protein
VLVGIVVQDRDEGGTDSGNVGIVLACAFGLAILRTRWASPEDITGPIPVQRHGADVTFYQVCVRMVEPMILGFASIVFDSLGGGDDTGHLGTEFDATDTTEEG